MRYLPSFFSFSCGDVLLPFLCNLQQYCDKILSLLAVSVMTLDRRWFYSGNIVIMRDLPSMLAARAMTLDRKWFYSSFCATNSNIVLRCLPSLLAVRMMTLDRM